MIYSLAILIFMGLVPIFSIDSPLPATWDCDDIALATVRQCQEQNLEYKIVMGDLERTGEKRREANHVWIIVKTKVGWIVYEQGYPIYYYEYVKGYGQWYKKQGVTGYEQWYEYNQITLKRLKSEVRRDGIKVE